MEFTLILIGCLVALCLLGPTAPTRHVPIEMTEKQKQLIRNRDKNPTRERDKRPGRRPQ